MAKYYYDKYTIAIEYTEQANWTYVDENNTQITEPMVGYSSYSFNKTTNTFSFSTPMTIPVGGSGIIYNGSSTEIYKASLLSGYGNRGYKYSANSTSKQVKGIFVSTIIAENGTYPDNGISGSYWYVKGSMINTSPTRPSSITVPLLTKGEIATITWGTSTDADGDSITYRLYRSVNGGSYTQIYSGSLRSKTDTILESWDTVQYQVRAYDGYDYSSYRTSNLITVRFAFPEMKLKIDGSLKTTIDGWTKIDGNLKHIINIWTKIDGVLKQL